MREERRKSGLSADTSKIFIVYWFSLTTNKQASKQAGKQNRVEEKKLHQLLKSFKKAECCVAVCSYIRQGKKGSSKSAGGVSECGRARGDWSLKINTCFPHFYCDVLGVRGERHFNCFCVYSWHFFNPIQSIIKSLSCSLILLAHTSYFTAIQFMYRNMYVRILNI